MARKMTGTPLFGGFHEEPDLPREPGAYPRILPQADAARAERELLAIDFGVIAQRIEAKTPETAGQPADRFGELAAVVMRVSAFLEEKKFATAHAHLRSVIERLGLNEGATP